ncbi:hypothetical protein [Staphylothermus hellenicus]|uniref:Uncharacterized protein n=1 Tax=Staphylothermus hellenicus (strain DSM 12710 / JCM 10830 / BK20S6-10-b1 / P8) TaxID=591019 RepID=D7DAZ0_STAHD|nr:hypothetical protein [Staphylothermus hellenicus]ADI31337.1 hypothetical protein Shell_0195 [Staphylothermus hellenicus DSM 12710]
MNKILVFGIIFLLVYAEASVFTPINSMVTGTDVSGAGRPKILFIYYYWLPNYGPAYWFIRNLSMYGDVVFIRADALANQSDQYIMDYLRQFDIYATINAGYGPWLCLVDFWSKYPRLVNIIRLLVREEGKSILVVVASTSNSHPISDMVYAECLDTPDYWINYEIASSNITVGINNITGRSLHIHLYGGKPLIILPNKHDWLSRRAALAVYGYYGKGKYAVLSIDLFQSSNHIRGDIEKLLSNIIQWLTNKETRENKTIINPPIENLTITSTILITPLIITLIGAYIIKQHRTNPHKQP